MQGQLLWRGPRVRMGMYEGQPVSVAPHAASGRADYFGPVCNRCSPAQTQPEVVAVVQGSLAKCQAAVSGLACLRTGMHWHAGAALQ